MSNILLLGAGFSANWGAPLAREVRNEIAMRLESDQYLSEVLNKTYDSFEAALQVVQNEFAISRNANDAAKRMKAFQEAVAATFNDVNQSLARQQFEFQSEVEFTVGRYLTHFDAIFSLNQDLLLERHYMHPPQNTLHLSGAKVQGCAIPGLRPEAVMSFFGDDQPLHLKWRPDQPPFALQPGLQPYFKLHGSTNWFSSNGEQMMVMGGDKTGSIRGHPVLMWYAQKFAEYLSAPGARLTIIGYSFRDPHINRLIVEGWQNSRLPMMIVAPRGRDMLREVNGTYGKPLYFREPLEDIISYESRRPLREVFGGGNSSEMRNLYRFLRPN